MKTKRLFEGLRYCLILHSAFFILHCQAAPLEWDCDWPQAKSQQFSLYHGESATFLPRWRVNGQSATNIVIEAVYIQTNGMADAWWPLDGATFAPSNDVGAASYRFFLRASDGDGILYRANGTLRMLDSPGFTPSAVALPVQTLDFATIEVANAKWPWSSITNAPTTWAWSAITGKPSWIGSAKPSYTAPEVGALPVQDWGAGEYAFTNYFLYLYNGAGLGIYGNNYGTPAISYWPDDSESVSEWVLGMGVDAETKFGYGWANGMPFFQFFSEWWEDGDTGQTVSRLFPDGSDVATHQALTNAIADARAEVEAGFDNVFDAISDLPTFDDVEREIAIATNYTDSVAISTLEYIEGTNGASTNWTGRTQSPELWFGKTILFHVNISGSGQKSLELTLPDGSTTGLIPIWGFFGSGARARLQNHYPTGSVVCMTYCEYNGQRVWHCLPDYDSNSNNYDRNLVTYCKAAEALEANVLTVGTTNGYYKLAAGRTFDLDKPILFCNAAQTAGKTNGNNWYAYSNGINLATTLAGWGGDATTRGKVVYLLGTVNDADRTFTIDAETPFSLECIPPCIPLGWYNANANTSFEFLPGELIRDDIPTKQWVDDEITIRLITTNAYISVSNGVHRIYEVDGTNRTLKWEWDMGFAAISNQVNSLVAQMLRKIEDTHTWANWAASGIANPFPGAVSLDRGSTYFGSTNVVWTARDGFAVMTAHMPATASGNASQFRIGVDADDWFGMEVTAAYLVDAHCDSFAVSQPNPTRTATITTDYDPSYPGAPPLVYFTESLAEPFSRLDTGLTWTHNSSTGVSTVTIQGLTTPAGFFFLKKWEAGGAIMRSTMPILPEGYRVESSGAYIGTVQPDSIITITTGGHTYRLIAEEVQ